MGTSKVSTILGLISLLAGALTTQGEESRKGFRFPGGDPEAGSELFVGLSCIQCHSVKGVHFEDPPARRINVPLADDERFVRKYEDIITAISNPKHVVQKQYEILLSKIELGELEPFMEDFTNRMTLRQFIDLVTFLDNAYRKSAENYGKP